VSEENGLSSRFPARRMTYPFCYFKTSPECPSSYKMGHQSGLSSGGSGSFV
jgi:hypothetical protein